MNMKKYQVMKSWPGVQVGYFAKINAYENLEIEGFHYNENEVLKMLKEGWIEEVMERKTLENKLVEHYLNNSVDINAPVNGVKNIAKEHYLGLLDEAIEKWQTNTNTPHYLTSKVAEFLRKYLESEGKL